MLFYLKVSFKGVHSVTLCVSFAALCVKKKQKFKRREPQSFFAKERKDKFCQLNSLLENSMK